MIEEFTWSFGGDSSAEQAIAEWKKQPKHHAPARQDHPSKVRVSKGRICRMPGERGHSFRAGFKLSEGKWKMVYFVGGD
jgi:hypothetical protein